MSNTNNVLTVEYLVVNMSAIIENIVLPPDNINSLWNGNHTAEK